MILQVGPLLILFLPGTDPLEGVDGGQDGVSVAGEFLVLTLPQNISLSFLKSSAEDPNPTYKKQRRAGEQNRGLLALLCFTLKKKIV